MLSQGHRNARGQGPNDRAPLIDQNPDVARTGCSSAFFRRVSKLPTVPKNVESIDELIDLLRPFLPKLKLNQASEAELALVDEVVLKAKEQFGHEVESWQKLQAFFAQVKQGCENQPVVELSGP